MSFLDRLFGKTEGKSASSQTNTTGKGAEKAAARKSIVLKTAGEEKSFEISFEDKVELFISRADGTIKIVKRNRGNQAEEILKMDYPENALVRGELVDMLNLLVQDIQLAQAQGKDITIPTNRYDLYMYMKKRPVIDVDMKLLEAELWNGEAGPLVQQFQDSVKRNCRVDVYYNVTTFVDDCAAHLLRVAYRGLSEVHFHDMTLPSKEPVAWQDSRIQKLVEASPNVPAIGIGLTGESPKYSLNLSGSETVSSLRGAAIFTKHPMTIREEMIDAMAMGHGWAAWEAATTRGKGEDFARTYTVDLAIEEACYRLPESQVTKIAERIRRAGYNEQAALGLVRVDFIDKIMLLNMLRGAREGFVAETDAGEILCYKQDSELLEKFGWTTQGDGWFAPPEGKTAEQIKEEVRIILLENRYVKELGTLLEQNQTRTVSEGYRAIEKLVVEYSESGLDEEYQMALLKNVKEARKYGYEDSIRAIIQESLHRGSAES